jgi:hypothetical protein
MTVVTVPYKIDGLEFWSSILGSTEFQAEWWVRVKYEGDAEWNVPGVVHITALNGDNEPTTKSLTLGDLVLAYTHVIDKEYHHCGAPVNIEDMDECASDMVLQVAMFGEVIYG